MEKQKKINLWTGTFLLLIVVNLMNGLAGMMTVPLVAKYALAISGDLTTASTVAGLMSLVSLVICPFSGVITDRANRKKLIVISSAGYGIALFLHAFATTIPVLIVLRLLTGIFFSMISVCMVAFSSSFVPRERMGEGLGYIALAQILAQALGPGIGLKLVDVFGYPMTFISAGASAIICMLVVLVLPYSYEKKEGPAKRITIHDIFAVEFLDFMLIAALFSAGNGMVSTYLAILADERGVANIALFFTLYSAVMVVLRPLTGRLLDKKGIYFIMIPSIISAALGMALIGVGFSLGMMLAASVFKAFGQGSGSPSMQADAIKRLDKTKSGIAASTILLGQNAGNAVGPIAGSFFVKSLGYEKMFVGFGIIIAVFGLIILYIHYYLDRRRQKRVAQAQ
ncbi:Predicted arabinose efflux permease, MFS family [Lachnospiraceae bacterium NK3A20]|jgi:MFS family permease|nr:Predicted arabinose efflux permease, MFS family [Lachnospiraceae bacterium NK3A20]